MSNHEITTGDVFNLVQEVRDSVIEIKQQVGTIVTTTNDHEKRLREVEDLKRLRDDVRNHESDLEELKRRVWTFSGAASVLGVVGGTLVNRIVGGG